MKLQKIVSHLQKLHPKEIDLSLNRIKILCEKLGNPQDKIKAISVVGTNGKQSTINAIFSILKESKVKCNVYTSPHIQKINERFVFNNDMLNDDELIDLFEEVEKKYNSKLVQKAVKDGDIQYWCLEKIIYPAGISGGRSNMPGMGNVYQFVQVQHATLASTTYRCCQLIR